jgi:hypothetical protein
MKDVPERFIPHDPKTIGEEPDPPMPGWARGGAAPTEEDYCPYCGELVKHFNQHAGKRAYESRYHRHCYLLERGFEEIEYGEEYRYEGEIETPNATIEFETTTGTFVISRKTRWRVDGELKDEDETYLQHTQYASESEEAKAAKSVLRNEFEETSDPRGGR